MEPNLLSSLVGILRESHVIFLKNKKLMISISFLILLLHSFLVLCNFFSIKSLLKDFVMEQTLLYLTNPGTSQYSNILIAMTADFHIFAGLEWFFILALSFVSLFSATTTILASAAIYGQINLSFKHLLSKVLKSLKRPMITWFYIAMFQIGYLVFAFASIYPFAMNFVNPSRPPVWVYPILILVGVLYIYLAVVWKLGIVISVVEERRGLEAFGKASQLVKGMKVQGFVLSLVFAVLGNLIVWMLWKMMYYKKGDINYMLLMGLVLLNITCVITMSVWMAFTVFYHKCKQSHGEEIELQGSFDLEYTKVPIPNQPLIGADMA